MFDTFEAFWSFLIPLLPRPALERWATIPSAHRHSPVGHVAGIHDPRSIATMITLSALESDRGPTLVRLAEPRQVLSHQSDPGVSTPARSKHLLEGTPKRGRRRRRTQEADPTPAYARQVALLRQTRPQPAVGPGHGHARVRSPAVRFHDLSRRGASPDRAQRGCRGTGHRRMRDPLRCRCATPQGGIVELRGGA